MAQSKTAPALDPKVMELHDQLVEMLSGKRHDEKLAAAYWDTSDTTFKDDFKARIDELLKTIAAAQPGAGSAPGPKQASS
jgi:hypothetical protein